MAADRRTVIENCAIATVDANDTEHATGHLVLVGDRIESLGPGPAPEGLENVARRIDATGHLATPGLVNTHHHFYQWLTRAWPPTTTSSTGSSPSTRPGHASTRRWSTRRPRDRSR